MIKLDFDTMAWHDMSDEERIQICDMLVNEFERLIKPLKNYVYNYLPKDGAPAAHQLHDYLRIRTNCARFTHDDAPRNWDLMWRSATLLYTVCYFLEYIVNPGIEFMLKDGGHNVR